MRVATPAHQFVNTRLAYRIDEAGIPFSADDQVEEAADWRTSLTTQAVEIVLDIFGVAVVIRTGSGSSGRRVASFSAAGCRRCAEVTSSAGNWHKVRAMHECRFQVIGINKRRQCRSSTTPTFAVPKYVHCVQGSQDVATHDVRKM